MPDNALIDQEHLDLTISASDQAALIEMWAKLWSYSIYETDWEGVCRPEYYLHVEAVTGPPNESRLRDIWDALNGGKTPVGTPRNSTE